MPHATNYIVFSTTLYELNRIQYFMLRQDALAIRGTILALLVLAICGTIVAAYCLFAIVARFIASRQPASQPARQPASRSASQPAGQPVSQPNSQPASQPTSQPANETNFQ